MVSAGHSLENDGALNGGAADGRDLRSRHPPIVMSDARASGRLAL